MQLPIVQLGIIGGSGFYQMPGVKIIQEHAVETPFGSPSDAVMELDFSGRKVFFIPRHGRGHVFSPSEVNYRANVYALKSFGVSHLISLSAVGIMREDIKPGTMVIPDQFYDRTKGIRESSFFGEGMVGHVSFADPICHRFVQMLKAEALTVTEKVFYGGTYVCIEGPQFSTRAESIHYRESLKPSVVGMTAIPEAKLAREAEMCYALLALATDYDCWHETEEDVSVEAVVKVLKDNKKVAGDIITALCKVLPQTWQCPCQSAAKMAVMTDPKKIGAAALSKRQLLYGKYFAEIT